MHVSYVHLTVFKLLSPHYTQPYCSLCPQSVLVMTICVVYESRVHTAATHMTNVFSKQQFQFCCELRYPIQIFALKYMIIVVYMSH